MRLLDFAARGRGPWRAQFLASYRHRLDISRDDVLRREPAQVCDGVHDPGHTSGSIAVAGALHRVQPSLDVGSGELRSVHIHARRDFY